MRSVLPLAACLASLACAAGPSETDPSSSADGGTRLDGGGAREAQSGLRFDPPRGFYDAPIHVTVSTTVPGAVVRYTTDGTAPTATQGMVFPAALELKATSTLRAAAFKDGLPVTNSETSTYLFLDDVLLQSPTGAPPPGWPAKWGSNVVDYGMDPDVVNDPRYKDTLKSDLKSIPTFALTMNLADLFDATTGIYANARNDGREWERPGSIELLYPDGRKGFQINAGVRIRGGFSRDAANPKHAFRLFFRNEYGAAKLRFPMFGPNAAQEFDKFDLRCAQNYSWSFQGLAQGVFLRDQFSRDSQLAMGHQAERGDFYHLYINGQYWGLYNTDERISADWAESYFGGAAADYDVIKTDDVTGVLGKVMIATDGDLVAFTRLYNLIALGPLGDGLYQKVQGLRLDGTKDMALENLIDVDALIDYMLLIFYTGNFDGPITRPGPNQGPNNYFGVRNRRGSFGFKFSVHDAEHSLFNVNEDRTGPYPAGDAGVERGNPQWMFQKLAESPEFRLRVADRAQRHFFGDGALTPTQSIARFTKRKDEIDRAVVAESARWGDAKRPRPFTRDDHWILQVNSLLNGYFPVRTRNVVGQLVKKGWYPTVAAPEIGGPGGAIRQVSPGFQVTMTGGGTVYFTTDGSDPRAIGGMPAAKAQRYALPVRVDKDTLVRARVQEGDGSWSALVETTFKAK